VAEETDDFPVPAEEPAPTKTKVKRKARGRAWTPEQRRAASERQKANPQGFAAKAGARTQTAALAEVRQAVAEGVGKAGALIMPAAPLPGGYCVATSGDLAEVVAHLAARNPKLLDSLSKASVAMDYVALGSWLAGFVVACQCQWRGFPVDHPIAEQLGVTKVYEDLLASGLFSADEQGAHVRPEDNGDDRRVAVPDLLADGPHPPAA